MMKTLAPALGLDLRMPHGPQDLDSAALGGYSTLSITTQESLQSQWNPANSTLVPIQVIGDRSLRPIRKIT
jgi:hypothetical protein